MEKKKFEKEIETRMEEATGKRYEVRLKKITKNNGQVLTALQVRLKGERAGALLYMEKPIELEDVTLEEERLLDVAAEKVLGFVRYGAEFPLSEEEIDSFLFWEKARNQVVFRLINREWNERQLSEVPHRDYLDLAVVYSICFPRGKEGMYLGRVEHTHAALWGVTEEDLYQAALENTPRLLGEQMVAIEEALKTMCPFLPGLGEEVEEGLTPPELYVLSNRVGTDGASALLYAEQWKELAERKKTDLYLLPSSIHEILVMPVDGGMPVEALLPMVRIINRNDVLPVERLSDNVYRYDRSTGKIRVIRAAEEERADES